MQCIPLQTQHLHGPGKHSSGDISFHLFTDNANLTPPSNRQKLLHVCSRHLIQNSILHCYRRFLLVCLSDSLLSCISHFQLLRYTHRITTIAIPVIKDMIAAFLRSVGLGVRRPAYHAGAGFVKPDRPVLGERSVQPQQMLYPLKSCYPSLLIQNLTFASSKHSLSLRNTGLSNPSFVPTSLTVFPRSGTVRPSHRLSTSYTLTYP
jgi:hypothetical protein